MREAVRLAVRRCATLWTGKKPVVDVTLPARSAAMKLGSILAIYFLFFAASAFFLLPFGVRTDEEAGTPKVPGQADSAPHRFDLQAPSAEGGAARARSCSRSITPTGPTAGSPPTTSISTISG